MNLPRDTSNLLEEILKRGTLRVSVVNSEANSSKNGFLIDTSRAIAAALFDNLNAIELVEEDFPITN